MLGLKSRLFEDKNTWYWLSGFTYVEFALALAIISFIVLAFTQLFLRSAVSIKGMQFQTLAYSFAGDKMEEIRNESFESIGSPWYPLIWETESQTQSGKVFTRNIRISQLESSLKRVDIEVIWTEEGQNKSIDVSTLIVDKW